MIFNLNILVNNEHLLTFQERRYLFSLIFFKFPLPPLFFFLLPIIFLSNCKPLPSSSSSIEAFYSLSLIRINVSSLHKDRITCLLLTPVPACFATKQTFWNAALFTNSKSRQTLPVFFLLIANYNHSHDFDRLELIVSSPEQIEWIEVENKTTFRGHGYGWIHKHEPCHWTHRLQKNTGDCWHITSEVATKHPTHMLIFTLFYFRWCLFKWSEGRRIRCNKSIHFNGLCTAHSSCSVCFGLFHTF